MRGGGREGEGGGRGVCVCGGILSGLRSSEAARCAGLAGASAGARTIWRRLRDFWDGSLGHLFGALLLLLPNLCGGGGAPCAAGPALRPFWGRIIGRCPRQSMTRMVLEDPLAPGGRSEPVNDLVVMRCRGGMICGRMLAERKSKPISAEKSEQLQVRSRYDVR